MALFVNKKLSWWSASITLDNNNDVLADFLPFFLLYTLRHPSIGLTYCISIVFSVLNILAHLTTMLHVLFLLGKMSKFPHTNHKRSSVRSHTLAPTSIYVTCHIVSAGGH